MKIILTILLVLNILLGIAILNSWREIDFGDLPKLPMEKYYSVETNWCVTDTPFKSGVEFHFDENYNFSHSLQCISSGENKKIYEEIIRVSNEKLRYIERIEKENKITPQ